MPTSGHGSNGMQQPRGNRRGLLRRRTIAGLKFWARRLGFQEAISDKVTEEVLGARIYDPAITATPEPSCLDATRFPEPGATEAAPPELARCRALGRGYWPSR